MRATDVLSAWAERQASRELATQRLLVGLAMKLLNVDELTVTTGDLAEVAHFSEVDARWTEDGKAITFTRRPRVPAKAA